MRNKKSDVRPYLARLYLACALLAVLATLFLQVASQAQQVHRNGFETLRTSWVKASADVSFDELAHAASAQTVHDGQRAEYLKINAQQGSHIYYQYTLGQAPITEELAASLWLKANRPGLQLLARVVLPNERDPNNLDTHLTTLIRGDLYRTVGRWQRLELGRPAQLAMQQQQLMQAQLKRSLNFKDAFVDALILNVYAGPGPTELWIDDLEAGPIVAGGPFQTAGRPGNRPVTGQPVTGQSVTGQPVKLTKPSNRGPQVVEFNGTQLLVGHKPFFFRAIRYSDTSLRALRDAGLNTVCLNYTSDPKLLKEAVDLGFWLVPTLGVMSQDSRLATADGVRREMARFSESDAILFWHLGGTLAYEQAKTVEQVARFMQGVDPGRPLGADVWDGLPAYSRSLQMLGLHRWPLMTTLELSKYHDWLVQRRDLANPDTFIWTWVQTHLPDWYTYLLYNQSGSAAFKEPVGPQPEQVRLLTYTALGAGCRGLAFWSDRFLADSHFGRDRLLCIALLNLELEMLEPLLSTADERTQWIDTSAKDVKAAVIRTAKGVLVIPIWQGEGGQFVPGQAGAKKIDIVVPQIPQSHRAWEVSPADVHGLRTERVLGGTKVTLRDFGLTAAVVFTSDFASEASLVGRFQNQARSRRQVAAQWSYDMTLYELEKVLKVEQDLEKQGHFLPDGKQLVEEAQKRLKTAREHWDNHLFADAYNESQRALRPVRILMRAQWDKAIEGLSTAVASPFAVSFFTLPRHWLFMDEVKRCIPTANVLPGGDFEIMPERIQDSWRPEEPSLDDVELIAKRVSEIAAPVNTKPDKTAATATTPELPHQGKQCLMLQIKPKVHQPPQHPPQALERTLLALTSPVVHLQPGTLVQITGWIRIPDPITASPDGALLYDSAGGEPLAIRLTEPTPWKRVTLYRRVPDSGTMHITLALTGIGTVYFDDVRIEPLVPDANTTVARPALRP
jgi:hypothetical protein